MSTIKEEVKQTLIMFIKTDIIIYGAVTEQTIDCFKAQGFSAGAIKSTIEQYTN